MRPAAGTPIRSGRCAGVDGRCACGRQREGGGQQPHEPGEQSAVNRPSPQGRSGSLAKAWLEHAGDQRRDEVDGVLVVGLGTELTGGHGVGERLPLQLHHLDARRERLRGGLEARDGSPEQQLGHGAVGQRPAAAGLEAGDQCIEARLGPGHGLAHLGQVVELAPQEQRVVDRHERREVLVERGGWTPSRRATSARLSPLTPSSVMTSRAMSRISSIVSWRRRGPAVRPAAGRSPRPLVSVWLWVTASQV